MGCPCFLEIFWLFIGKYCIANIIYLIGTLLNMAFPQYFFLCTQKNFRWLYAVGFAPSLKHWWFYQSNPVLLYGLSRTGRIARWTSSQGPVIETSQLFQCIFEIKTNVRPHYHPITSRYRHDAIKNWLDFSPFLLFFLFNNLSFILSTLKKNRACDYISTFMNRCVAGVLNFPRVYFSWNLWNILGVCEKRSRYGYNELWSVYWAQCYYGFTKLISFLSIFS